jgi:hypothetical protein
MFLAYGIVYRDLSYGNGQVSFMVPGLGEYFRTENNAQRLIPFQHFCIRALPGENLLYR